MAPMPGPWQAATYVARLPLWGDFETQVAVVGGGIAGAALTYFLSHRRVGVVLVEAGSVGAGASGQSHGLFLEGIARSYAAARKALGADPARAVWDLTRQSHHLARLILAEERFECGYARRGSLRIEEEESAPLLRADGFAAEATDRGLVVPGDGEIDPARFARALVDRAAAVGVKIYEQTPVRRIQECGGRVEVSCESGKIHVETAVVAAGAATPGLCPSLGKAILPVRGRAFLSNAVAGPPGERPIVARAGGMVVRPLRDGRLLAVDLGEEASLETEIGRFVAAAAAAGITERWAPTFGFSADPLPFVGALAGSARVRVLAGFGGSDLGLGIVAAKMLQEALTDGGTGYPIHLFDPGRLGA